MDKLKKLSLPATVIIASLILGSFFYASQVNKQRSIERQQDRNYVAKRKDNCYEIYEKERAKWSNVDGNFYNEKKDICVIVFKNDQYNEAICKEKREAQKDQNVIALFEGGVVTGPDSISECGKYFTKEF